ncbi:MAG TPA: 4Fe-4S dicluster domain-containing protein [Syntrophales bacterium]|nr:4Fe-4S dicluster domain-containing protein [Syntrophales bacterium]HOM06452.1 4Fe-4S dicluster domain-containing protein [Syntrophales bacterium]HON99097.1 4Fe-4S dicluster domain-containing protein [Syntrophales bacterium]HPC00205.1 4Fe-4S dicluster domain-containing protein [Syntrophales bacterium]HPQ05868.1 4Fe-4S dicluster domain-containing protein [Syntrophales bacterium]
MKDRGRIGEGDLKAKLGWDVFKQGGEPHIRIRPGKEGDPRLRPVVSLCPAGLWREEKPGTFTVTVDGCLECGTCRILCGPDLIEWEYPEGGLGVQFRFG